MQMIGRLDGENAIKDGEGYMFSKMAEWGNSTDLKQQYPRVNEYVTKVVKDRAELHKQERRHQSASDSQDTFSLNFKDNKIDSEDSILLWEIKLYTIYLFIQMKFPKYYKNLIITYQKTILYFQI